MMRFAKKTICLMLAMLLVAELLGGIQVDAKEISLAIPKVSTKLIKKKTGIKVTIGKTKDADGYEVSISGTPANSEYGSDFWYKDTDGHLYTQDNFSTVIEKNGTAKRSLTYKNLQPGTYTIKVRSWNNKKYGTKTYSEWSKEKTFTLKEAVTKGYSNSYDFSEVKKGDVVKFGVYEQDLNYTNGKEAIEWIVLKKTKNSVLLLSKYALDILPYHKDGGSVTWENCSLRKWLNSNFIKSAFNKTEQGMIKSSTIENFDNTIYKTVGGNDTKDKVFLMSQLEMIDANLGFAEDYETYDVNRRCAMAWKKNKKGSVDDVTTVDGEIVCGWWLRSPGSEEFCACYVRGLGIVDSNGYDVDRGPRGVRPALYISLK